MVTLQIISFHPSGSLMMEGRLSNEGANRLLAGMPREQFAGLRDHLERVSLKRRATLIFGNRPIEAAYFLESGLASAAWSGFPHRVIDVAVLGRDGMGGSPLVLGLMATPFHVAMLTDGTALRVRTDKLLDAMARDPKLRDHLLRAPALQLMQVAQTAACNGVHPIRNRLPRWLLMCHDKLDRRTIHLSHDTLSEMLGVRRAGIGEAMGLLERKGVIHSSHGVITVLDRSGLEAEACGCYRALLHQEQVLQVASAASFKA